MKRILMKLMLLCATAPALTSCIDDEYGSSTESDKDTYIHLNVSTAALQTRASDESVANPNTESDIHSVRVWAFNSDLTGENILPVSYKEETNLSENSNHHISMKIPRNSGGTPLQKLDLFILANAESGTSLYGDNISPKEVTRKDLQTAKIANKYIIDADGKPTDTSVPDAGLPISRYVTDINVDTYKTETESATGTALNIPMQRTVSKLHFFFARKTGSDAANTEVTKIELDGNCLSQGSYVFPDGAKYTNLSTEGLKASGSLEYISGKTMLNGISSASILAVSEPKDYIRGENEDATTYLQRLADAGITSQNLAYYNETDKAISGTIYYKMYTTGEERSARFSIPAEYGHRNHELLVYGYFNAEGHLELNYSILDWDQTANTTVETKDLTYLNVYPTLVFMRNVDSNEEVNFFASDACTVSIEEVYYYDKNNEKQTISKGNSQYPTVTIKTGAKQGTVSISSEMPTNLTVKYIRFKVTSGTASKEVLVKQYPLEYVQAIDGWYSTKSLDGWIDWQTDQTEHTTKKESSVSPFQAKVYYNGEIYDYNDKSTSSGGPGGGGPWGGNKKYKAQRATSYNDGQNNNHMYVVQITQTDGTYTIGHVNNIDETTKLSDENVVSPAFALASQLGTVSPVSNSTTASKHCDDYIEVGLDGTRYEDWRLPTAAEIGVIVGYQYNESQDVITEVLRGKTYWALNGTQVETKSTNSGTGYVRCVRDLSPEEVTKLEQSKQ